MNELIKVTENENNEPIISCRELHKFLQITERFSSWFERMVSYGFVRGVDYVGCKLFNTLANQELQDYALKLDMAKEISMIQRNDRGKQARQYFIDIEKKYRQSIALPKTFAEALRLYADEVERRELLEAENETLEIALNESLKYYTVAKYNKTFKMKWNKLEGQQIGREMTAYCKVRRIDIKSCETNDERFGTVNSYPLTAWEDFLNSKNNDRFYQIELD